MFERTLRILGMPLLAAVVSFADSGTLYDDLSFKSKILGGGGKYTVYLLPDYQTSQPSYPALYLLHDGGGGDDQTGWMSGIDARTA